ncbi:hypothetical protein FB451DRAFT_1396416 [Mycena latifolia]|nr:hypothetical protein FB451DRAFT_1396416 [Mycena latifolia]
MLHRGLPSPVLYGGVLIAILRPFADDQCHFFEILGDVCSYPLCPKQFKRFRNPLAVGSPGFIGVVVAGGLVLLVIGILLGRCIHRDRSQLDMAAAPRPSTVMAQTNDPEMSHEELRTQSRRSSDNEASTIRPPVGNSRTNEPATAESQFLDSVFRPANSGSATHPVANSRTWNDSGAQESQFLSESPPPDRAPQAATAPQPRRTSGAAPRTGAAFHPVHELSSDSEPEGSTTYAGPSSHARTAQQRRSQYQPQGYPTAMGQGVQDQQEWQRHMRMWSASVASERRHSTPDSDSTTRYATPDSTAR